MYRGRICVLVLLNCNLYWTLFYDLVLFVASLCGINLFFTFWKLFLSVVDLSFNLLTFDLGVSIVFFFLATMHFFIGQFYFLDQFVCNFWNTEFALEIRTHHAFRFIGVHWTGLSQAVELD